MRGMVSNEQVRRLLKLRKTEKTLATAAAKTGMDEKTARKWLGSEKLPSQCQMERSWRTRADVFSEVWSELEGILERAPTVQAKTLFDYLSRRYEGRFQEGQLRTLQRRVKAWRAVHGEPKEVIFPQRHRPGEQAQSDFTYMGKLGVTLAGQPFDHLLYHFVLTYSNWETVMICFSESFESLSAGLQKALWELGAVPREHRTDSLTTAVHKLSHPEEFTERYRQLLDHYGLEATHSQAGQPPRERGCRASTLSFQAGRATGTDSARQPRFYESSRLREVSGGPVETAQRGSAQEAGGGASSDETVAQTSDRRL